MAEATLQRVFQLNEHLARLSSAGVPLDLEMVPDDLAGGSHSSVRQAISRANAALQLRVELGQPLEAAIDAAPELSPRYRASLKTWLQLEDPAAALDPLTVPAQRRMDICQSVSVSLIQPMIVVVLTFIAFVVLCLVTVPRMEAIYSQLWKTPTGMLAILLDVRDAMPIWIVVLPIVFIAAWVGWRTRSTHFSVHRFLPGGRRYLEALRHASFAEQVAMLLQHDVPLEQSMLLADPVLGAELNTDRKSAPPLLRWALTGDLGGEPLWSVLRFVSLTYRQIAEQYAVIWRVLVPTFLGVFIGGVLVLIYGLSLFLPMIDLLELIAFPEQP